uniref:Uncharacterized protein n=1 Tax=Panagrolaimus davidi TaxID=227884 RepID=A0A914QBI8_9BILA
MKKNIDLTLEIQQFSDVVLKSAGSTKSYKSTMIVRPFYVKRSDLNRWISKEDLMRGRNYARHRSSVVNISSINQKEIAGEKSTNIMANVDDLENGDLPNASIPQTSNSQPSSPSRKTADEKFVSPSDPLLIPQLMHSVSTPNLEGKFIHFCLSQKHTFTFPSISIAPQKKKRSYAVVAGFKFI